MTATHQYPSILDAVRGCLVETCQCLNSTELKYVVAGGWVPYLRSEGNALSHPGTNDVDILLGSDWGAVKAATLRLLERGYVPSAKHPFQILKELSVAGRSFVFNVDLMYPTDDTEAVKTIKFKQILDLGVKNTAHQLESRFLASIPLPGMRIIFAQKLWAEFKIEGTLPSGENLSLEIPLMDESGLLISKCRSVDNVKRGRDAFDIFLLLSGRNVGDIVSKLTDLAKSSLEVKGEIRKLVEFLSKPDNSKTFDDRVRDYAALDEAVSPAKSVMALLRPISN